MSHTPPALERLGYAQYLNRFPDPALFDTARVARVVAEHRGSYDVAAADGEHRATVTGRRMVTASGRDDYPAVGDWVLLDDQAGDPRIITEILPRLSTLHKRYAGKEETQLMVANADVAFIVESTDRDYSPNRFERYVVLAREGGVQPVLVVNKSDLLTEDELRKRVNELQRRFGDVDILSTSTVAQDGLSSLTDYIKAQVTYCFLGSSGVGKSTLINCLLEHEAIATQSIGARTYRGRHTTTARAMYITAAGAIIIDNPGSRGVGITDSESGIKEVFDDIEALATGCKFANCAHTSEPGCSVLEALASGAINQSHYENYLKLVKEAAHFEASALEKRQKARQFGKFIKSTQAELNRYRPKG